jgi:outer membrane protein assembly factor BamD (BamD/ComL family)
MQVVEKPSTRGNVTTEQRPQTAETDRAEQWLAWAKANQRRLTIVAGVLVVIAGAIWFGVSAKTRRETFARRELDGARMAAESGNLPLAANDLSRIASTYGGTRAGQEAVVLLAQVRLLQDQPEMAVNEISEFIADGPQPQYRGPAYAALGAALEDLGRFAEAGQAYEEGARASEYALVAARFLLDAGRAYMTAADTAAALRIYQQILRDHGETGAASEARLRMAELGQYQNAATPRG